MTASRGTSSTRKVYEYNKCVGKIRIGNAKCSGVSIPRCRLNDAVMEAVEDHVLKPKRIRTLLGGLFVKHQEEASQETGRTQRLASEIEESELALKRIYGGVASGILDPTEQTLKAEIDDHRSKRDAAQAALANMKENKAVAEILNQEQIPRFASQLSEQFQKGMVVFPKGYLRILLGKIIVHKGRVELFGRTDKLVEALALSTTSDETKVRAHV